MMSNASLYSENCQMTLSDANFFLQNYLHFIKWQEGGGDILADVGCGDAMHKILLPKVPNNFSKMIGLDISKKMIEFARVKWQHPKISFEELDIDTKSMPVEYEETFDHVFSMYCLNLIPNQRNVLSNIRKMLKKNGDCFITILVNIPNFDVYDTLSRSTKWRHYMKNAKDIISFYNKMKEPHLVLEKLLNETGFYCKVCNFVDRSFVFSSIDHFKDLSMSVNVFFQTIPDDLKEDYVIDFMNEIKKFGVVPNEEGEVPIHYQSIVAVASKIN